MQLPILNPVPVEELEAWARTPATALLGNPYDEDFARRNEWRRRNWIPERVWGAKDRDRWVATLATHPRGITVPGPHGVAVDLAADAVTGVGVSATHRRQGLLRRMISASLASAREVGEAVSILVAAEWPIYGRFGYAPAVWGSDYVFRPRERGAAIVGDPTTVRQIDPGELLPLADAIFDGFRRSRSGQVRRGRDWWARRLGLDGYLASTGERSHWFVHEGPGGPDGLLSWKVTREFDLEGNYGAIAAEDFFATTDDGYRDMAAYLAGIDVVSEITMKSMAVDEPLRWLLDDARVFKQTFTGDWVWLRLLDVPAALSARAYTVSGRLVIDVVDDDAGFAAGRYLLDGSPEGATCRRTTESADLRLDQRALASAYLGGQSLQARRMAGGVEELSAGALGLADAMLRTPWAPSNATGF